MSSVDLDIGRRPFLDVPGLESQEEEAEFGGM
jgi:hypothetical protein